MDVESCICIQTGLGSWVTRLDLSDLARVQRFWSVAHCSILLNSRVCQWEHTPLWRSVLSAYVSFEIRPLGDTFFRRKNAARHALFEQRPFRDREAAGTDHDRLAASSQLRGAEEGRRAGRHVCATQGDLGVSKGGPKVGGGVRIHAQSVRLRLHHAHRDRGVYWRSVSCSTCIFWSVWCLWHDLAGGI